MVQDSLVGECVQRTWAVDVNRWGVAFGGIDKVWSIRFSDGERIDDGGIRFALLISERAVESGIRTVVLERLDGSVRFRKRLLRSQEFIAEALKRSGVEVVYLSPAHTSSTCPTCGSRLAKTGRWYVVECPVCRQRMNRDWVAVQNLVLNYCGRPGRI